MPSFVVVGAGGPEPGAHVLHRSQEYGSLALDAFASIEPFGLPAPEDRGIVRSFASTLRP